MSVVGLSGSSFGGSVVINVVSEDILYLIGGKDSGGIKTGYLIAG